MRILDALEKKINRHSYDTWLKPTRYSHSNGGILFVRVPTAEFRHVGDKYADLIQEAHRQSRPGIPGREVCHARRRSRVHAGASRRRTLLCHDLGRRQSARLAVALRLGWRRAAESALHLRRLRHRQRQPVRPRRLPGGRRASFEGLQPALPLRRRRHGQDPPDAGHRARDQAAPCPRRPSATSPARSSPTR